MCVCGVCVCVQIFVDFGKSITIVTLRRSMMNTDNSITTEQTTSTYLRRVRRGLCVVYTLHTSSPPECVEKRKAKVYGGMYESELTISGTEPVSSMQQSTIALARAHRIPPK